MFLFSKYKAQLTSASNKTKVLYEILGDDRLSEKQKRELADYMQQAAKDRMSDVYKRYKK